VLVTFTINMHYGNKFLLHEIYNCVIMIIRDD